MRRFEFLGWVVIGAGVFFGKITTGSAAARAQEGAVVADDNRLYAHRVEWEGPLDALEFSFGELGQTTLHMPTLVGEQRSAVIPFVRPWPPEIDATVGAAAEEPIQAHVLPQGGGRITLGPSPLGGADGGPTEVWALPFLPAQIPVLPKSVVWLAAGWCLALVAWRRKPLGLIAASGVFSAVLLAFVEPADPSSSYTVRLLEHVPGEPMQVLDSARDRLSIDLDRRPRVLVEPQGALHWRGKLGATSEIDWSGEQTGALLRSLYQGEWGPRALETDLNSLAPATQVWVRAASGLWEARGPWALGAALPQDRTAGADPPAWLIAGLPQGASVWLARLETGAFSGGLRVPAQEVWVRWRLP